jgi:hypothetical protein
MPPTSSRGPVVGSLVVLVLGSSVSVASVVEASLVDASLVDISLVDALAIVSVPVSPDAVVVGWVPLV